MSPVETFKNNLKEIDRLINFDRELLQIVTSSIETLHNNLKTKFADERINGKRTLDMVQGIRTNDSLRSKYKVIYNQAIVLLVSHFSSALGDLFRQAVTNKLESKNPGKITEEEFKLTVADLRDPDWNTTTSIPDLLIAKYDFTFQDMAATCRAFTNYTEHNPLKDELMNNIIVAQACRHSIVHAGGRVSDKTLKQISKAFPRSLKLDLTPNSYIEFSLTEVELVKQNMLSFIEALVK